MPRLHRVLPWYFHPIGWKWSHENALAFLCPFSTADLSHNCYPSPTAPRFSKTWWCLFVFTEIPKFWRDQKDGWFVEFKIEERTCVFCDFCIIKWKPWMDMQLLDTTSWRDTFFESNLCQSMPGAMRVLVFSPVNRTASLRLKSSKLWGVRR